MCNGAIGVIRGGFTGRCNFLRKVYRVASPFKKIIKNNSNTDNSNNVKKNRAYDKLITQLLDFIAANNG